MKVAILSPTVDITNGYGNFTFEYCQRLAERDDLEFILYLPEGSPKPAIDCNFPIKYQLPPWILSSRNPLRLARYFAHRIAFSNADLIHSIVAFPYALSAMGNSLRFQAPYVISAHGTYAVLPLLQWPTRWFLKEAYRRADRILAVSQFTSDSIRKLTSMTTPVEVIHSAIHFERFQEAPDIRELKSKFGPGPVILSVGALKRRKGQDTVLKAFKILKEDFSEAKYLVIGTGSWEKELEDLACSLGIHDSVFFLGKVSYNDLVRFYHLCDVYTHLPRNVNWHYEGFGMVYLEAGACGKPVVGTLSGGVPDAVIDGETGLLVPENNPQAAAEALIQILSNPTLAQKLGNNGHTYARQHSWKKHAESIVQVYKQVLRE